jgi:hypothetical protein
MFKYIYNLIGLTPKEQQNRIVILKGKLVNFAETEKDITTLLNWRKGEDYILKNHKMTVGQKWSTVVKAFTLNSLTL